MFGSRKRSTVGGDANLGVYARSDQAWMWLDTFLTVERLQELLPETAKAYAEFAVFTAVVEEDVVEEEDLCVIKVNYLRGHFKIY